MAAHAEVVTAVVKTVVVIAHQALSLVERAASFSCPSMGSHSISAVAPDHNFKEELANAA